MLCQQSAQVNYTHRQCYTEVAKVQVAIASRYTYTLLYI